MQNKVEICGVNTAKLKVLKNDEMQALLLRSKAGDREAREQLISGNLRLVLSVIQRFSNRGENADDLFQVGCIGLIKAIDNFNTDLDVRFSTYGVPMNVHSRETEMLEKSVVTHGKSRENLTCEIARFGNRTYNQSLLVRVRGRGRAEGERTGPPPPLTGKVQRAVQNHYR